MRVWKRCVLGLMAAVVLLSGCSATQEKTVAQALRFTDAVSVEAIRALDGQYVTIIGYMATLSPVDGTYMYLMNMPYQSCPFCVPNTTQLANTMAVYAKDKQTFAYTDQAIEVTGRVEFGDFSDSFGYVYAYRIVDATYTTIDLSNVSDTYALWQSIASDGIVADVSAMFDYLYFLCQWTEYQGTMMSEMDTEITYNLYPGDALEVLQDDGLYGYAAYEADGYFPGLLARIRAISTDGLTDLEKIVADAQTLARKAHAAFDEDAYTYNEAADKYTLNDADAFVQEFDAIYERFSLWLAKWEV